MKYLTVDGMLNGTGIRDSIVGGYLDPSVIGVSLETKERISKWLSRYEDAHYMQYQDKAEIEWLDLEGIEICKRLISELPGYKICYYSSAKMSKIDF